MLNRVVNAETKGYVRSGTSTEGQAEHLCLRRRVFILPGKPERREIPGDGEKDISVTNGHTLGG